MKRRACPQDPEPKAGPIARAKQIDSKSPRAGRTLLTESESKQLLELYGIPTVRTMEAQHRG